MQGGVMCLFLFFGCVTWVVAGRTPVGFRHCRLDLCSTTAAAAAPSHMAETQ